MHSSGYLRAYVGCMFSGKTSELIREFTRYKKIGKNVICINYADDERYGEDMYAYSHDLNKIACTKAKLLLDIPEETIISNDVILINEGQFFKDLLNFCKKYCDEHNKHIIVCGLDGDYLRQPFGQMNELISIADEITKLKAFCTECKDGTPAIFTWRMSSEKSQISINNDYIPVCRYHYLYLSNKEKTDDKTKDIDILWHN